MTEPKQAPPLYPVICLMGPTASGKSDLSLALADRFACDIISVDSALIYRGMDIGTAKPNPEILKRYQHHLIDICDPTETYSAAQFCQDALTLLQQQKQRGKIPLLVGGTMLYFRALQQGLAQLPAADEAVRQAIYQQAQQNGWLALHEELARVDPESAKRIHPNDPQRLQRALEVYRITGKSLTSLYAAAKQTNLPYQFINIILQPSQRGVLHDRIAARFHEMLDIGLLAEVSRLYQRGDLSIDIPSMRCVGYRQVWQYLAGEYNYPTMIERSIIATRQLAKRQMTWLRDWPNARYFECDTPQLEQRVGDFIRTYTKRAMLR